jgi:ComF family protein
MRKALHKIKYNLNYAILEELLQKTLLSEKIKYCLKQEEITLCTEIPMHKQKLNTRGFNQAQMIAKWLEKRYKLEYSQLLIKTKQTTPQMQLHRFDRYLNLKDAFQLNPKLDISQQLQKKSVLIVDDVTTTGTTLEECAKLLKKQGIQKIWGLVLASGK